MMRLRRSTIHALFVFFVAVTLFGCATAPSSRAPSKGYLPLNDICRQKGIVWSFDAVTQVVTLNDNGRYITAMAGSDITVTDDTQVVLSRPLKYKNGELYVPPDFVRVIEEMQKKELPKKPRPVPAVTTIVIDAGHGGKDPGAIGVSGMHEKVVALDIAKRLAEILRGKGYRVVMTRETDVFISLEERTQIASRAKADLFVSIHANAHGKRSIQGMEVYCAKPLDWQDLREEQRLKNHKILFRELQMKQGDRELEQILGDMLYTHKQGESVVLAKKVAEKASREARAKNLGQKFSRFYVLRNTLVPAVLVETGFLSNPNEEKQLKKSSYRATLAKSIAKSIEEYLNGR